MRARYLIFAVNYTFMRVCVIYRSGIVMLKKKNSKSIDILLLPYNNNVIHKKKKIKIIFPISYEFRFLLFELNFQTIPCCRCVSTPFEGKLELGPEIFDCLK